MATKWKSIVRQIILWAAVVAIMATTLLGVREGLHIAQTEENFYQQNQGMVNYNIDELFKKTEFRDSYAFRSLCDEMMGYYMDDILWTEKVLNRDEGHAWSEERKEIAKRATVTGKIYYTKASKKKTKEIAFQKGQYKEVEEALNTFPNTYYARVLQEQEVEDEEDEDGHWNPHKYYYMETTTFYDEEMTKTFSDGPYTERIKSKSDVEKIELKIILDPELVLSVQNDWETWTNLLKHDILLYETYFGIILAACVLILICASPKDRTKVGVWVDRIYLEIHWILFLGFFFASLGCVALGFAAWAEGLTHNFVQLSYIGMLVTEFLGLYLIISAIRKLKDHYYFRSSIAYKLVAKTFSVIGNQTKQWNELRSKEASTLRIREKELKRKKRTLIVYAVMIAVMAILFLALIDYDGIFFFFGVLFETPMIWIFLRLFKDYRMSIQDMLDFEKVLLQIDEIAGGDLNAKTDIGEESLYYAATTNLEGIGQGLENSMKEQLKSERMKVDLITNVSHDLKTPLTSIIGYIDLLSKDETLSEESRDYVSILEKKSDRLRNIVTDLFDLAKTTSGNVDVNLREIDLRRLTQQTLAEMGDAIEESGFAIVEKYESENATIKADADRMYRVIQNVMDNALKYSLKGSRIYVTLKDVENDQIKLEVINTASYQMDFDEAEITERFRRGDEARSTEGSGLGLSIADSFTTLSGGHLEVHTTGDQFMVEITFDKIMN